MPAQPPEEQNSGLWASFGWELRIRAICALILFVATLLTGLQGPLGFTIPEGIYTALFPLLVYVVGLEILGLVLVNLLDIASISLFARTLEYGFFNSAVVRWTCITLLIIAVGWYILEG